jgi:cell division septation protein DedD
VSDEGFREIQLNGKQLVFLFMAATVVSVVIFLCGVLVGRGVRSDRPVAVTSPAEVSADRTPASPQPSVHGPANSDGGKPDYTYTDRLLNNKPAPETLKDVPVVKEPVAPALPPPGRSTAPVQAPSASAPAAAAPPPSGKPTPPPSKPANQSVAAAMDPSGPGFAVQVGIFENRREADVLAKQLIGKGYPAFVVDPVKGTPKPIFRVRVGKYKNRKDAEEVSARLERDEQFKPWIAR